MFPGIKSKLQCKVEDLGKSKVILAGRQVHGADNRKGLLCKETWHEVCHWDWAGGSDS